MGYKNIISITQQDRIGHNLKKLTLDPRLTRPKLGIKKKIIGKPVDMIVITSPRLLTGFYKYGRWHNMLCMLTDSLLIFLLLHNGVRWCDWD